MTVPLLLPAIPPLSDLPGHMGRYRIMTAIDEVPSLARGFQFDWRLIGNLGVDLLMVPFAAIFGVELGTKLIIITIPVFTAAGMLWLAKEVHGHIPPTALFVLPLAYAYPFHFGFVNYSLAVAVTFPALALWLHLGRKHRIRFRAVLFAFLAFLLWLIHTVGWGLLVLSVFAAELARQRQESRKWPQAFVDAAIACVPLAVPLVVMLLVRGDSSGTQTSYTLGPLHKIRWLVFLLRDRWMLFDIGSVAILGSVGLLAIFSRHLRLSPVLLWPSLLCAIAYLLMPNITMGSFYADMRLLPFAVALGLLAIRVREGENRMSTVMAVTGGTFLFARLAATTASFLLFDASFRSELRALSVLPNGASVFAMVDLQCSLWNRTRLEHLSSMAIVRKDAFVNDQFEGLSAQLVTAIQPGVGKYRINPSQIYTRPECVQQNDNDFDTAISDFPRAGFDYVWTIGFPPGRARASDLKLVWGNAHSAVYSVVKARSGEEAPRY